MKAIRLAGGRVVSSEARPLVMGILNMTPDSFYPGSRAGDGAEVSARADRMASAGADIIDIGGESSRPGSDYVDEATELDRVLPAIEAIRSSGGPAARLPISVDTRKSAVAARAIDAGADIINDISGLRDDPELLPLAADRGVPVVVMHMQGSPSNMQKQPHYDAVVSEVRDWLETRAEHARDAGLDPERIILDPGLGFGKRHRDNKDLIASLGVLCAGPYPVLLGASRKSFIGRILAGPDGPRGVEGRLAGSLAVAALATLAGISILRVHDVAETADLVRVLSAISTRDSSRETASYRPA
jgi:dihydropteroate synthase